MILTITIMTLFCNGWYLITHDGMIIDPFRKWFLTLIGGWDRNDGGVEWDEYSGFKLILIARFFYKPLFGCIICMSSIPGSVAYWLIVMNTSNISFIYWPIACICCSFTNYFLYLTLKKLEE